MENITVNTDTKYLTFVTAMNSLSDARRAIQDFELQALIHKLNGPEANALKISLKKSFVDTLSLLCALYVSDETPAVFDDSIIHIFKATYDADEFKYIIDGIITASEGSSVFEEMLRVVKNDEDNK